MKVNSNKGQSFGEFIGVIAVVMLLALLILPGGQNKKDKENFQRVFSREYPTDDVAREACATGVVATLIRLRQELAAAETLKPRYPGNLDPDHSDLTPSVVISFANDIRDKEKQQPRIDEAIAKCREAYELAKKAGFDKEADVLGYQGGSVTYPFKTHPVYRPQ